MLKIYKVFPVLLLILSTLSYSQTPSYGNLEIYTREVNLSSIGYFSGSFQLPDFLNRDRIDFNGLNYTYQYDVSNLGNVALTNNSELRVMLEGIFKVGAAIGEKSVHGTDDFYPSSNIKYYLANLDLFTLSVTPKYTVILDNGYAVCAYLGIDIINLGGSLAVLDQGVIDKHTVGVANIVPLTFRPAVFFDFGRSGVGIGAYINAVNILNYRVSMSHLYPDERGLYSFDSFFRKFEFQLIFTF